MENEVELLYRFPIVVSVSEGKTDIPYLRMPLSSYFKDKYGYQCKTISLGGDLTSDPLINDEEFLHLHALLIESELSSPDNKIDEDIAKNIQEIVQIIDIDQVFLSEDLIIEDDSKEDFFYTREGTLYKSKDAVIKRNLLKIKRINQLLGLKSIHLFNRDIPFSLYFYSVNIDDFHNNSALNLDDKEKAKLATLFERKYLLKESHKGKVKLFLSIFAKNNPPDFPDGINESWDYIKCDNHCLLKCSNAFLIVEKDKR